MQLTEFPGGLSHTAFVTIENPYSNPCHMLNISLYDYTIINDTVPVICEKEHDTELETQ